MKRISLIILTAVYLVSCVGIGVNRFYCCGKLAAVTLIYGATDNTEKEAPKKDSCCKNEKHNFKLKDSYVSSEHFTLSPILHAILPSLPEWKPITFNARALAIQYQGNAPPPLPDIAIYTLNCTYRI